jgi:hydrogenase maturation factor
MSHEGKVDREYFERVIRPHLGAERSDVALGPAYGVDFGVVDVGGRALVLATDPLSILPGLGYERAARFALHVVLSDVAVSGIPPSHLTVGLHLPPGLGDDEFERIWTAIHEECADLGVAVATGHTGRYEGCRFSWVGAATAIGVGDHDDVVRPDGARPGDRLLLTTGPAVESAALLSALYGDRIDLPDDVLSRADGRIDDLPVVRAALSAAAAGPVTAMHDATERGVVNAVREMAESAGVRVDLDLADARIPDDVARICDHFGMDPWVTGSAGSLLVAVRPGGVDAVRSALAAEGGNPQVIGRVSGGSGTYADGDPVTVPDEDPFTGAYRSLLGGE